MPCRLKLIKTKYNYLTTTLTREEEGCFSEPGWGCVPEGCVRHNQSQVMLLCGDCRREIQGRKGWCTKEVVWPREHREWSSLSLSAGEGPASSAMSSFEHPQQWEISKLCWTTWRETPEQNLEGEKGLIKCKYGYYEKKNYLNLFFLVVRARSNCS